jgi:MOSC domain-containing protein YiiM
MNGTGARRMTTSILSVQTGGIAPLGPERIPSGFVKLPRAGAVHARFLGLEGDVQADLSVHGGPEKAVYAYAASHYPGWALQFPALAIAFQGGAMGENLTVAQMDETAICVGDIHGIGTARLQVCQPRQPCYKFALRHNNKQLPRAMVRSGYSGWYYRVLEEGEIRAGDGLVLLERPNPDFAFTRLVEIVYRGGATPKELARMVEMPGLASQWRDTARLLLR